MALKLAQVQELASGVDACRPVPKQDRARFGMA